MDDPQRRPLRRPTETQAFGTGRRENHDSSIFYDRFPPPKISDDDSLAPRFQLPNPACIVGDSRSMSDLPDNSVALVVTSPPYFVGKEYEVAVADNQDSIPDTYLDYLAMLRDVFAECCRVLEPGGRIAVNVANLGRKPYRSLSSDIITILQNDLQLLLRGEIIWQKAEGATGSVAWGSFRRATNPVLRDVTERVIVASKGRFNRARTAKQRATSGHPATSTLSTDEFMEATLDLWRIDPESARRVNHPAPFPVELPQRLIELYTYRDDIVLDPFLGSGSTVVAAQRSGRRGIGYDLEPGYVRAALDRLEGERYVQNQESPYQRAAQTQLKMMDIVHETLSTAGFASIAAKPKIAKTGLTCDFLLKSKAGQTYYVDIAGAFTTIRPGLLRSEAIWKMLGRANILTAQIPDARLLILTSALPKPGSSLDKTIRAVGRSELFDVVALYDDDAMAVLRNYAEDTTDTARGFWST